MILLILLGVPLFAAGVLAFVGDRRLAPEVQPPLSPQESLWRFRYTSKAL